MAGLSTANPAGTTAEAFAVRGHAHGGSTADLSQLQGVSTRVIEAYGRSVTPVLSDTHVYFNRDAFSLDQLDFGGLKTLDEAQDVTRKGPLRVPARAAAGLWLDTRVIPRYCRPAIISTRCYLTGRQ